MKGSACALLIFFSCFFFEVVYAAEEEEISIAPPPGQSYGLETIVSMTFGKSIGVDENYATLGAFFTKVHSDQLYYIDTRWHHLCNQDNGINAGAGIRFGDLCKGCGVNLYYDWRYYRHRNFQQIDFGFEGWRGPYEFNFRAYMPAQGKKVLNEYKLSYLDGYHYHSRTTAYPCQLVSMLASRKFNFYSRYFSALECRFFLGPYWISRKNDRNHYGGIAGIDFKINSYCSLKGVGSYDPIFNTRFEFIVAVTIPFGCDSRPACGGCTSHFDRRPERLDLIPIKKEQKCNYNWKPI